MQKRYKVLNADLRSPYRGYVYELGIWHKEPYVGEPGDNRHLRGLYAGSIESILYCNLSGPGEQVYECEVRGRSAGELPFGECWEELRVVRMLTEKEVRKLAREANVGYRLEEALYPVNPLEAEHGESVTQQEVALLKEQAAVIRCVQRSVVASVVTSIWNSAGGFVWDSVWRSVQESVLDMVWASVQDFVVSSVEKPNRAFIEDSVRDAVCAYIGSLFPGIRQWEGVEHEPGVYPFQAGADLWRAGLIPVFNGTDWMLFT